MTQTTKPRGLGRIVLVASLALNVLLAGAIIGSFATGRSGPPRSFDAQLGPLGQILTKEQRAEVGRELRRAIRAAGIDRPRRNQLMVAIVAILEAEEFDQTAFATTITKQYRNLDALRDVALGTIGAYFAEMSVDERRAVARTLQERSDSRGGAKGTRGSGG